MSVVDVNTSVRLLMWGMWCSSPANMWTIFKTYRNKETDIWACESLCQSQRSNTLTLACVCGGVPAEPGPKPRLVGRRYRSPPASLPAEEPWVQNHVGGFELIYQKPHTLPGRGGRSGHVWVMKHTYTRLCKRWKPSYLYHLRVMEPFAEDGLDQSEDLLQHNDHPSLRKKEKNSF